MMNAKTIGKRIAESRKNINLSQAELAQQVAISPQAVGKWERGESLPDIITLNQLAQIFRVDLNYFSAGTQHNESDTTNTTSTEAQKNNWDMSSGNWVDADFSGLKNLNQKFSNSNMQNCKFIGSDLSNLVLENNHLSKCDFTKSDFSGSNIQKSYFDKNIFVHTQLQNVKTTGGYFSACDFSGADFAEATFLKGGLEKCDLESVNWKNTKFTDVYLGELKFNGRLENCSFENCDFHKSSFENATFVNCFFKNNRRFKKVKFTNCEADTLSYAFLKTNLAELSGITLADN